VTEYIIETGQGKKGRSFHATAVALATAEGLWTPGGGTIRPVYAQFAGTDAELKSFVANLRAGKKAEKVSSNRQGSDKERIEFLKTVKYHVAWQREAEGSLVTVFHPELFLLDPGLIDPVGIRFLIFTPTDWAEAQQLDRQGPAEHVARLPSEPYLHHREGREKVLSTKYLEGLVPTAYLFACYVDRRTRCPLVADGRFYVQLLIAALDKGLASFPGTDLVYHRSYHRGWGYQEGRGFDLEHGERYKETPLESIGLQHAIAFSATHPVFEAFLAEQVTAFFTTTGATSSFQQVAPTSVLHGWADNPSMAAGE
jgi:hypothetical protein